MAADQQSIDKLLLQLEEIENAEILRMLKAKRISAKQLQVFLSTIDPHQAVIAGNPLDFDGDEVVIIDG